MTTTTRSMATAFRATMMATLDNSQIQYIVNLFTLYFLPPKAAAAGRANVARVTGWRDAGEHWRGQGGFFSGML